MNNYKLGSLFDGSGGFPLAGALCGIEPVWAAEVEPYPIAVTKSRFPRMKHLGDISKVNGAEIEPNAHEKYYLSAKACVGILRRAERRGKQLPPMLKEALEQMIEREKASMEETEEEDDSWTQ